VRFVVSYSHGVPHQPATGQHSFDIPRRDKALISLVKAMLIGCDLKHLGRDFRRGPLVSAAGRIARRNGRWAAWLVSSRAA